MAETIALIPSGYKATKVYSQLPVNGNGDFTFDRGTSTAQTRVNKDGLIESVAQDVPRLDYLDGGCPSLLLEPATTNLITYSEDFNDASWTKSNATITVNQSISPDGTLSADEITDNATNDLHVVVKFTQWSSATLKTASIFAKKNTADYLYIANSSTGQYAFFNLSSGTLGTIDGLMLDAKIEDYGNGWYRCSVSNQQNGSLAFGLALSDNTETYSGSGDSIYIWGAQLEQQSYATSYIPTSGSTATRAAETCNGAGTTAEINSQEGVLFGEIRGLADNIGDRRIALSDGTTTNRVFFYLAPTSKLIQGVLVDGGVTQCQLNYFTITQTEYHKVALHYKENDMKLYVNGLLTDVDTSATMPTGLNELAFDNGVGSANFYGRVKRLSVYNSALTDLQLEALTGFGSFSEMASYLSYS